VNPAERVAKRTAADPQKPDLGNASVGSGSRPTFAGKAASIAGGLIYF
jgi:hypothetical protein